VPAGDKVGIATHNNIQSATVEIRRGKKKKDRRKKPHDKNIMAPLLQIQSWFVSHLTKSMLLRGVSAGLSLAVPAGLS